MARRISGYTFGWPFGGLNKNWSYEDQPDGTSWDLQNVRGYDPGTGRNRGAKRAGLSKYVDDRTADGMVQDIGQVASRTVPSAQTSVNARTLVNYAVTNGTVAKFTSSAFTTATSGSSALAATVPAIFSTELFGVVYFADGTNEKKWTASTNTVSNWVAGAGSLPDGGAGEKPRLIETWRSRIVCSGVENDAHNWFMSAVGDATDFDYSPTTEVVTQAVAGNNAEAGKSSDIINGMIPYNDDILIFLGDHTIHQMTGDPAEGGRIDRITDQVGGAWGRAWCKDPSGGVYFFGSRGGVYRMVPGSMPESISLAAIEEDLATVDLNTNLVRMAWNDREKGFHLFITPLDNSATTHYFWDARNQAWLPDVFATADHNPTATYVLDGDDEADRHILLGGQDGYIRKLDPTASADDGAAISAHVWLGPVKTKNDHKICLHELEAILGAGANDVSYDVYVAENAETATTATAKWSGTMIAGRRKSERRRAMGHQLYLKLYNNTLNETFAFERVDLTIHSFDGPRARQW